MSALDEKEKIEVHSRKALREWLSSEYERTDGIWLVRYKKPSQFYVDYNSIVEECLCFGWIDSLPRKLDDHRSMLYISPRKKGSNWSSSNKQRIEKLIKIKQMHPAGLEKVKQAKKDGSWSALTEVSKLTIPKDLQDALSANATAYAYFDAFPPSSKRGILEWILNAKTQKTRDKRIKETVDKAAENIRANHYRQPLAKKKGDT